MDTHETYWKLGRNNIVANFELKKKESIRKYILIAHSYKYKCDRKITATNGPNSSTQLQIHSPFMKCNVYWFLGESCWSS